MFEVKQLRRGVRWRAIVAAVLALGFFAAESVSAQNDDCAARGKKGGRKGVRKKGHTSSRQESGPTNNGAAEWQQQGRGVKNRNKQTNKQTRGIRQRNPLTRALPSPPRQVPGP